MHVVHPCVFPKVWYRYVIYNVAKQIERILDFFLKRFSCQKYGDIALSNGVQEKEFIICVRVG